MRNARIWGLIAVMVTIMAFPAVALAQQPPNMFVGSVTQDGVPVPEGTEVTAWIDGVQVGAGNVTGDQYQVLVVQPEGQSFDDKTVTFQVAGKDVPETAIWQVGGATEVNLSAPALEQPSVNNERTPPEPVKVGIATPPPPEFISQPVQPETLVTDAEEGKKRRAFVGVVDGEPGATVDVVRNGTNERVTISLDDYKLKQPGKTVAGSFTNGARVVILSQRDGEDWVAIWVMVKPQKLVNRPVVGTVVGVENGVLSIIQPDGTTSTVELPDGAQAPETGEVITLFTGGEDVDATGGEIKGPPKVKGLVKASKIKEKLQKFLQDASEGKGETLGEGERGQPQLVTDVAAVLQQHDARHVAILEKLSQNDKVPAAALAKVKAAFEKAKLGRAKGQTIAAEAKAKAGPPSQARGGIFGKGKKTTKAPQDNPGQAKTTASANGKPESTGKPKNAGSSDKGGKPESNGKPDTSATSDKGGEPESTGEPESSGSTDKGGKPESTGKPESVVSSNNGGKPKPSGKPESAGSPDKGGKPKSAGTSGQGNNQGKKK